MGKQKYTAEFREEAVRLVVSKGVAVEKAAADLGMPPNTPRVWITQSRKAGGRPDLEVPRRSAPQR